ncbi:mitochondrial nicotinamide adenine dinucleotide transporter SLC25A51 [Schistocerca piceifrons]|uniref:mitochondrial nicotinamide adenine dinucleotide transporter SLC25A51 n=1 Tax=Schistocerca piceifrons TaxID=274613 RepID=UPI001F5F63A9|nr:mitochondrial nicotinamide adenine dinucleotide transporter SLC25A51 [Schistocerca piceifrons]XP_047109318.1 mitochondrial nicotinamide adenine dinucleotide transporter SLC25A51 [Schistocerca piceifrons]
MTCSSNTENTMQQNESPTRGNQLGITDSSLHGSPLHRLQNIRQKIPVFRDVKEYVCGWGAAFINITVTYPIYKIIFRQMLHGVGIKSAFQQLSNEGIYFLYRGILPPLCQKTLSLSLMFGLYEECRRPLEDARFSAITSKSIAAMIAGSVEAIFMPFERIQTLLQDRHYHNKFKNTSDALRHILIHHGFSECYRGLIPILLRNGPSNVMFFLLRDEAKEAFPKSVSWYRQMCQDFVSGAVIGAFTSTVFYPLNVIKVQMQCRIGGEYQSVWVVLSQIHSDRGLKSIYSGVHLNYTRAFMSWGVINVAYSFLKKIMDEWDVVTY